MKYLLDTHALIWYLEGDSNLSDQAKKAIEQKGVENYISIASLWEIAIKINVGKLVLQTSFTQIYDLIKANGFLLLPVTFEDTLLLSNLELHHRDPFDRMIVIQSISNGYTLISKDKAFKDYPVKLLW